jgi:hypothetical protein
MVAKKLFHVWVGFIFAGNVFIFTYLGGVLIYLAIHDSADDPATSIFSSFPRFAPVSSVALPLALGVGAWRSRRYVSIGMLFYALASLTCWLVVKRPASLLP